MYGELMSDEQGGREYENRFGDNWEYMDCDTDPEEPGEEEEE